MANSDQSTAGRPGVPTVLCPACGQHMRLVTVIPEDGRRERMNYRCDCGFDYSQSLTVAAERGL